MFYVTCATSWRNPGDKAKGWPWMQRDAMALYTAAESVGCDFNSLKNR